MTFAITGSGGQLGRAFQMFLEGRGLVAAGAGRTVCDITSFSEIDLWLDAQKPSVVINAAAYNRVDAAEDDPETAFAVNALGPRLLARACAARKIKFVHFSTDHVFDGKKRAPYVEGDAVHPLNVYGAGKLEGEKFVCTENPCALVLRTSWVYGGDRNFLNRLLLWAGENKAVRVAEDETSVPTSTEDIVQITLRALDLDLKGVYHATSSGTASRLEWARYFLERSGLAIAVTPALLADFKLRAARPLYAAMNNSRIAAAAAIRIPHWQEGVDRFTRQKQRS
jgi:dTDP-4-dehydrorhamnose reductase